MARAMPPRNAIFCLALLRLQANSEVLQHDPDILATIDGIHTVVAGGLAASAWGRSRPSSLAVSSADAEPKRAAVLNRVKLMRSEIAQPPTAPGFDRTGYRAEGAQDVATFFADLERANREIVQQTKFDAGMLQIANNAPALVYVGALLTNLNGVHFHAHEWTVTLLLTIASNITHALKYNYNYTKWMSDSRALLAAGKPGTWTHFSMDRVMVEKWSGKSGSHTVSAELDRGQTPLYWSLHEAYGTIAVRLFDVLAGPDIKLEKNVQFDIHLEIDAAGQPQLSYVIRRRDALPLLNRIGG